MIADPVSGEIHTSTMPMRYMRQIEDAGTDGYVRQQVVNVACRLFDFMQGQDV